MGPSPLTVVMYHYVRPIAGSAWPRIRGLELSLFRAQLAYFARHYVPVTVAEVIEASRGGQPLPAAALLLTFDDGFAEHHRYVTPLLVEYGMQGAFYPPSGAVLARAPLDVHKVHHILASADDVRPLVRSLERRIESARAADVPGAEQLESLDDYRARWAIANRWDPAEVIYLKRLLQTALPAPLRTPLCDALFEEAVGMEPELFAESLYVSVEDLREMVAAGMHVGSHGHSHGWLNRMSAGQQRTDLERSLALLDAVGQRRDWTHCYPYGGYDASTLAILRELGCALAFTCELALAPSTARRAGAAPWLEIPRLDTNDLPKDPDALPNEWTRAAVAAPSGMEMHA